MADRGPLGQEGGHHSIDRNPALTRRLYDTVVPGEMVPPSLADEIRRYRRPQQFVPFAPEMAAPPFLVFQDAEQNQRRVALFLGANDDQLRFRGVSPVDEAVAISRIQVATARMAEGDKILTALNEADFVDYCVLRHCTVRREVDARSLQSEIMDRLRPSSDLYDVAKAA